MPDAGSLRPASCCGEGVTMIPFDRTFLSEFDRFQSGGAAIGRTPRLRDRSAHLGDVVANKPVTHRNDTYLRGDGAPEVRHSSWLH
jgi:phosphoketolase